MMKLRFMEMFVQDHILRDFPGGPVVKNLPSNAGDAGSIPGRRSEMSHDTGQLNPCAVTSEPMCSRAHEL